MLSIIDSESDHFLSNKNGRGAFLSPRKVHLFYFICRFRRRIPIPGLSFLPPFESVRAFCFLFFRRPCEPFHLSDSYPIECTIEVDYCRERKEEEKRNRYGEAKKGCSSLSSAQRFFRDRRRAANKREEKSGTSGLLSGSEFRCVLRTYIDSPSPRSRVRCRVESSSLNPRTTVRSL